MFDIVSLIVGLVSIILSLYAIWFAKKESKQTTENYLKTKELLDKIEMRIELVDRTVQTQPGLINALDKALDKISNEPAIGIKGITIEEVTN